MPHRSPLPTAARAPRVAPSAAGRAAARLARVVEVAAAEVDLSLAQFRILAAIDEGVQAPSSLAGRIGVSRPSITALVDGLVARGLVEREADPADRRRVLQRLTDEGRDVLGAADAAVERTLSSVAAFLPAADARRALGGLALWTTAIRAAREATR